MIGLLNEIRIVSIDNQVWMLDEAALTSLPS